MRFIPYYKLLLSRFPYGKLMVKVMVTTIRHYLPSDQLAVSGISADTAYFGEPVEAFLEDRRLYNDAFIRYYIEYETAYIWVAEAEREIVGFLLGCVDTGQHVRKWRSYILARVLTRAIAGQYRLGKHTANFAMGMLLGELRGKTAKVSLKEYPAHLQIDIQQGYRGEGIGSRLIAAYLEQLRQLNVIGVHLETTSHNAAACHLYEKVGFTLLECHPNRYWTKWFGFEVQNRRYGLKIS